MSNHLTKYLQELEIKLLKIRKDLKSSGAETADCNLETEIEEKIEKLKSLISKNKNTYLVRTKNGYLTANGRFTDNIHLAYTYPEDQAVAQAKRLGGRLEELPES